MKKYWVVRFEFICCRPTVVELVFEHPPTRADLDPIFRNVWLKEPIEIQDATWHYILILDTIPNIPWIGKLESIYGSVECFCHAQS